MTRRIKAVTVADLEAWARYLRHVRPLPGVRVPLVPERPAIAIPAPPPPAPPAPMAAARHPATRAVRRPAVAVGMAPAGLDRATWNRFRGGKIAPERTLDLHGMTTATAHVAVTALIGGAVAQGLRCVDIVTGHGKRGGGEGVLRREVPFWLNDTPLRALILAVCHPHAANQGALRVLLRRIRA